MTERKIRQTKAFRTGEPDSESVVVHQSEKPEDSPAGEEEATVVKGRTLPPTSEYSAYRPRIEAGQLGRASFAGNPDDPKDIGKLVAGLSAQFPEDAEAIARSFGVIAGIADGNSVEESPVPTVIPPPADGTIEDDRITNGRVTVSEEYNSRIIAASRNEDSNVNAPCVVLVTEFGMLRLPVIDRLKIGRAQDNDMVVEGNPFVSKHHVILENVRGRVMICDAGSRNGTMINNEELTGLWELHDTDKIFLGDQTRGAKIFFSNPSPAKQTNSDAQSVPKKGSEMKDDKDSVPDTWEELDEVDEVKEETVPEPEKAVEPVEETVPEPEKAVEPVEETVPELPPLPKPAEPEPMTSTGAEPSKSTVDLTHPPPPIPIKNVREVTTANAPTVALPTTKKKGSKDDDKKKGPPIPPPRNPISVGQVAVWTGLIMIIVVAVAFLIYRATHGEATIADKTPAMAVNSVKPEPAKVAKVSTKTNMTVPNKVEPAPQDETAETIEVVGEEETIPPNPLDVESQLELSKGFRPIDPHSPIAKYVLGQAQPRSVKDCMPKGVVLQELDVVRCVEFLPTAKERNKGIFEIAKWVLVTEGAIHL